MGTTETTCLLCGHVIEMSDPPPEACPGCGLKLRLERDRDAAPPSSVAPDEARAVPPPPPRRGLTVAMVVGVLILLGGLVYAIATGSVEAEQKKARLAAKATAEAAAKAAALPYRGTIQFVMGSRQKSSDGIWKGRGKTYLVVDMHSRPGWKLSDPDYLVLRLQFSFKTKIEGFDKGTPGIPISMNNGQVLPLTPDGVYEAEGAISETHETCPLWWTSPYKPTARDPVQTDPTGEVHTIVLRRFAQVRPGARSVGSIEYRNGWLWR